MITERGCTRAPGSSEATARVCTRVRARATQVQTQPLSEVSTVPDLDLDELVERDAERACDALVIVADYGFYALAPLTRACDQPAVYVAYLRLACCGRGSRLICEKHLSMITAGLMSCRDHVDETAVVLRVERLRG